MHRDSISIARALYAAGPTGITILDDPLSALDAHVGKAVFHQVIQTSLPGTRILVTHALHFLPFVDYIITMDGSTGSIAERGTFDELIAKDGAFAKFIRDFGGQEEEQEKKEEEEEAIETAKTKDGKPKRPTTTAAVPHQMQEEERNTGAVKAVGVSQFLYGCRRVR